MKNCYKTGFLSIINGLILNECSWAEVVRPKNDTLTNTIQSAELKTSSFSSMPQEISNRHIILYPKAN